MKIPSLNQIEHQLSRYASSWMQKIGKVPPTVCLWTSRGMVTYTPRSVATRSKRNDFADIARDLATAHNASGIGLVAETWMARSSENLDSPLCRPSLSPDRIESLLLISETKSGRQIKVDLTLRDCDGRFQGFGEYELKGDQFTGRFLDLLPQGQITMAKCQAAARRLRALGVLRHK